MGNDHDKCHHSWGNAVQGLVTGGRPTDFSVGDAIQHLSSLGKVTDPCELNSQFSGNS